MVEAVRVEIKIGKRMDNYERKERKKVEVMKVQKIVVRKRMDYANKKKGEGCENGGDKR